MDPIDRATSLLRTGQRAASRRVLELLLADTTRPATEHLHAWLLMAAVCDQDGEPEAAIRAADRAAALARQFDDAGAEAESLCLRAAAAHKLGLMRDAVQDASAALAQARTAGDGRVEAMALRTMSNRALVDGDEAQCRALLDQSLECARRARDSESEFWALNNISNVIGIQAARQAEAGDGPAARALTLELVRVVELALEVARRRGDRLQLAFALSNLADAYIVEGDHARARELLAQYAGIAREHGFQRLLAYANLDEVRMLRAEGRPDAAIAVIATPSHRALLVGNEDLALTTETALYEMHKLCGRFEAALLHHETLSRLNVERLERKAEQQVSVMMARLDLEQAQAAAERSRLDAALSAHRAQVLELEREHLRRAAHEDALTGTGNRRAADEALARSARGEPAAGAPLFIALVDIDHFKRVNDTHGHAAGDAVLAAMGNLMRQALRSRDQVFRYGGEEFLLILADASEEIGFEVCDRLRQTIERHDWSGIAPGLAVTASFGLARRARDEGVGPLVRRADEALYAAKREGRNRVALA